MFFERFFVRLGLVLAPFLAPKLVQNRLKIASRRFLRPYLFKNADFHADLRFPMFFHQNRPQDEAKIGLGPPQDDPKTVSMSHFFDAEICVRFCCVLGGQERPRGGHGLPKSAQDDSLGPPRASFADSTGLARAPPRANRGDPTGSAGLAGLAGQKTYENP